MGGKVLPGDGGAVTDEGRPAEQRTEATDNGTRSLPATNGRQNVDQFQFARRKCRVRARIVSSSWLRVPLGSGFIRRLSSLLLDSVCLHRDREWFGHARMFDGYEWPRFVVLIHYYPNGPLAKVPKGAKVSRVQWNVNPTTLVLVSPLRTSSKDLTFNGWSSSTARRWAMTKATSYEANIQRAVIT
ncbi:hypothetical protein ZHAS_00016572 [Anopheles sinensis]|uniref:Uncharacterized protein n=1 Tax=Anopheles sinensis TaxID=74873 RepID=A0A084WEE2_ANOSI|nr:hypothetical protein ZHAS_00016572 [Anopheles sinensis]